MDLRFVMILPMRGCLYKIHIVFIILDDYDKTGM